MSVPSSHAHPTVDDEALASHESSVVRSEKTYDPCHFLGRAKPLESRLFAVRLTYRLSHIGSHVGFDEARTDNIAGHLAHADFFGRRLGMANHPSLSASVVRLSLMTHQT